MMKKMMMKKKKKKKMMMMMMMMMMMKMPLPGVEKASISTWLCQEGPPCSISIIQPLALQ